MPYTSKPDISGIWFKALNTGAASKSPEGSPATQANLGKVTYRYRIMPRVEAAIKS